MLLYINAFPFLQKLNLTAHILLKLAISLNNIMQTSFCVNTYISTIFLLAAYDSNVYIYRHLFKSLLGPCRQYSISFFLSFIYLNQLYTQCGA